MAKEAMEIIEVIDTAVKIGLAGLITGATAYLIAKANIKKEISVAKLQKEKDLEIVNLNNILEMKKITFENKIKMVTELSDLLEEYFNTFHCLTGTIGAKILNEKMTGEKEQDSLRIKTVISDFTSSYFSKNKSLSKIKILQITEAENAIFECSIEAGKYLEELRKYSRQGIDFPEDLMRNNVDTFNGHKDDFYTSINEYISSISK